MIAVFLLVWAGVTLIIDGCTRRPPPSDLG
jgi:hypothetical protein